MGVTIFVLNLQWMTMIGEEEKEEEEDSDDDDDDRGGGWQNGTYPATSQVS